MTYKDRSFPERYTPPCWDQFEHRTLEEFELVRDDLREAITLRIAPVAFDAADFDIKRTLGATYFDNKVRDLAGAILSAYAAVLHEEQRAAGYKTKKKKR